MLARVSLLVTLLYSIAAAEFRAGAAKLDITPPEGAALQMRGYAGRTAGFERIHDPLFVRAIALHDGTAPAAIVTLDLSGVPNGLWETLSARIFRESGIAPERLLLAATHTHGGPTLGQFLQSPPKNTAAYTAHVETQIMTAVKQALGRLVPARAGAGSGRASVNMNRRARMAEGDWWLGYNPDGPSDKTVAVIKIESAKGEPIALLTNYAVHGTVMGSKNMDVTGDLPGAISRVAEGRLGDKAVVAWTSGAAGDQNPIYRQGRFSEVDVLGQIVGEEVVRVAAGISTRPVGRIFGAQKVVECPGQKAAHGSGRLKGGKYEFLDAPPVPIRLSALRIGHIALAGVSGEVLVSIGQRLKKESSFTHTMVVTHCNGSSGYLPDDAAYEQVSYEIVTARVKRGCAENAIVGGLLDLLDR
jgi:hypothetical protein